MKSSNQLKYLQVNNSPQQAIKLRKMKPIFSHKATWRCFQPSDISYVNKYKPKMLFHVSINRLRSENIGAHGIRNLCKAFKDSKAISSAFFDHPIANAKQLEYLLNSKNQWRSLSFISRERRPPFDQEFIKTLSRIGRCKKLSDFTLPNLSNQQHIDTRTAIRIYQQLNKLNQLKSLAFSIPLFENAAILNYRLPRSLISLHLNFQSKDLVIQQQQLSRFITKLQHCHLLEQLTLTFSRGYLIELADAQIWTSFFQNTPTPLKKFHINFYFSRDQPLEGVQAFIESLKLLQHLNSLRLSSFHSWILDQPIPFEDGYFPSVFTSLQFLTQLENLELKLYSYRQIINSEIQNFASMLQSLKNLKNLVIQFPLFRYPGEGLVSISQALKHATNLKTLELRSSSGLGHKPARMFYNNITQHHHLTSLCLDLRSSPFYHNSKASAIRKSLASFFSFWKNNKLAPFFSDLQNFTQLSTLELRLSAIHNSPREWKTFSFSLQKLSKLSSLHLSFVHLDSAKSFKGPYQLLSCLKNLSKLTQLELAFEGSQISDREIESFSLSLAGCQSLTALKLQFKRVAQLKDESLYTLLLAIRGLLKLQNLNILFQRQPFGEKAVSDFLEGLVVLTELSKLYFLYNEKSILWNDMTPLPLNLKGYENLRHLTHFIVNSSRYI